MLIGRVPDAIHFGPFLGECSRLPDVVPILVQIVDVGGDELSLGVVPRALADPVARAMRRSVREDPQSVADALFPVMGPAIRKAIVETVRGMFDEAFVRAWRLYLAGFSFGGGYLVLHEGRNGEAAHANGGMHVEVQVEDVNAEHARLKSLGLDVGQLLDQPWGERNFQFRDPDGYLWSYGQPTRSA